MWRGKINDNHLAMSYFWNIRKSSVQADTPSSEDTRYKINNIHKCNVTTNVFLQVLQTWLLLSMRKFLIPTSAHGRRLFQMLGGRSVSKVPQRKKKALTNQEQVTSVQLPPSGWSVKEAWTQGPQLGNCRTDTTAQGAHRTGRGRGQPERWGQRQARLAQNHGRGCCRGLAGAPSRCCCWNRVIPQRKRGERQTLAFSW